MSDNFIQRIAKNTLRRIVRSTVARQKSDSVDEVFRGTWASLSSNRLYRWTLRRYASDKDYFCIHTESLKFLIRTRPELFNSIKVSAESDFIDELRSAAPFIAVQVHDGAPNLTKLIADQKRPFSRIVGDPERHLKRLKDMQFDTSNIDLIGRDVRCFSRLRTAVRNKHIICCAIDYKDENGRWAYMNPAIFGFAKQLTLPVIFTKNDVDSLGCVRIRASKPHIVTEPALSAAAFQEFYNSIPGKKIGLTVKRYYE